jgi:putative transposase
MTLLAIMEESYYILFMTQDYRHNTTTVHLINYHFVWIPRRRRKVLIGPVAERLRELILEKSKTLDCEVLALEIMPDHAHLFLNAHPRIAPYQIMHDIKGYSAHVLRLEFADRLQHLPSMWTRSYFVSTAGNVSSDTIRRTIDEQKTK